MRRTISFLTIGLLLVGLSSARAMTVKQQYQATALWLVPTDVKNSYIGYYANVHIDDPSEGTWGMDYASLGKGRCTQRRDENSVSTSCGFRSFVGGVGSEHFQMDPLLTSAELRLPWRGKEHVVTWTADGTRVPGSYQSFEMCSDGEGPAEEGQGGGILRTAATEAHVFDKHLKSKPGFRSMLMSGLMVTECDAFRALSGLQPGETARVSF